MAGMLRFKGEEDFKEFMKRTAAREHHGDHKLGPAPKPPAPAVNTKPASVNEDMMAGQISAVGNLPEPIRQYPHIRGRKHTLDFAWPDWTVNGMQIGVEVQGMCHTVRERFNADIEKRALGTLQGWLILEVGPDQIKSGKAMEWLQELFKRAERKNS